MEIRTALGAAAEIDGKATKIERIRDNLVIIKHFPEGDELLTLAWKRRPPSGGLAGTGTLYYLSTLR
jgi:hypothetical protein